MRALEIPAASHRKTSSAVEQVGTDDFSESDAVVGAASEGAASEEDAPEGGVPEDSSDTNNPAEGVLNETEDPCPAHSGSAINKAMTGAMTRGKSQLTRLRFNETSRDQSGFRPHNSPFAKIARQRPTR